MDSYLSATSGQAFISSRTGETANIRVPLEPIQNTVRKGNSAGLKDRLKMMTLEVLNRPAWDFSIGRLELAEVADNCKTTSNLANQKLEDATNLYGHEVAMLEEVKEELQAATLLITNGSFDCCNPDQDQADVICPSQHGSAQVIELTEEDIQCSQRRSM